jgi:hypothetical protein
MPAVNFMLIASCLDGEVLGADLAPLGLESAAAEGSVRSAIVDLIRGEATREIAVLHGRRR